MDGFGLSASTAAGDNAIKTANTPNLDRIFAENPTCKLSASGLDVGLPDGFQRQRSRCQSDTRT